MPETTIPDASGAILAVLKIIHFLSFTVAIGAGTASLISVRALASLPPDTMPTAGRFRKMLGMLSTIGLAFLWATGLAMIMGFRGTAVFSDAVFQWKMAAVVVLTLISAAANFETMRATMQRRPANGALLLRYTIGAQIAGVAALVLAVISFG